MKSELGLKVAPAGATGPASLPGPTGPQGPIGDVGFKVKGLDEPAPVPVAVPEKPPKAFIILIRHITKGTLHVVSKPTGELAEFDEMEHAINASAGIPACQKNPSFVIPIYE